MKVVEGVYGNSIAADYRKSKLPARLANIGRIIGREFSFWFLTALMVAAIGVFGFAVGVSLLGVNPS
jgi:hypothetical protein